MALSIVPGQDRSKHRPSRQRALRLRHASTDGQALAARLAKLEAAGAGKVFREKVSRAERDQPQLARLLASLLLREVVLVARLGRLARSTRDPLNVQGAIADKGALFRSLGGPVG